MKHIDSIPHKRLIDVLVLGKYTQGNLNAYLKEHSFPTVSSDQYKSMRNRLTKLFPEHFADPDKADSGSLDMSGLRDMYAYIIDDRFFTVDHFPKDSFDKAYKAWDTPQVRRALQAMAFAQISEEEIELYSNAKYGIGFDTEVYYIFFKYFFDSFDWTFLERRTHMEEETDRDLKLLYNQALTNDADFVVWKLGLAPNKDFPSMLEDVVRDSYYNFKQYKNINEDGAQKWAALMLKAMDKIKDVEPMDKDNKGFGEEFKIQLKSLTATTVNITANDLNVEIPDYKEGVSLEDIKKLVDGQVSPDDNSK